MNELRTKKCYSCLQRAAELIKLPSGKYICSNCIDLQLDHDSETPNLIDSLVLKIDPTNSISFLVDQSEIQNRKVNKSDDDRGAKIARLTKRLNEFESDLPNYSSRLKRAIDVIRYEVELNYQKAKSSVESCLLEKINMVELQSEETGHNYTQKSGKVVTGVDQLISHLKTIEFKNETQFKEYESALRRELFRFEMGLNEERILETKNVNGYRSTLGVLKAPDNRNERIRPVKTTPFSVDSILALKNQQRVYQLKSMISLAQPHGLQDMHLLFFKCDETASSNLKLYNHIGNLINRIEINDPSLELYLLTAVNKSNLILCARDTIVTGSFVKLSLYNSKFELVSAKSHMILSLDRYQALDMVFESTRNKLFVLMMDSQTVSLVLFVFNLNLDLLNSFHLEEPVEKHMKGFKIFALDDQVYLKRRTSVGESLAIINSVYGRCLKTIQLSYEFENFYVTRVVDGSERLVFQSNGKYLVYDLKNQQELFSVNFSACKSELTNFFTLNSDKSISTVFLSGN